MRDLIEEADAGIGDVVDLAAGAARQHIIGGAPMRFEPARRHPFAFAIAGLVIMAPTLVFLTLSLIGHELGFSAVASVVDPIIVSVTKPRVVDLALVGAPLIALALAVLPLLDLRVESNDEGPTLALRVRALTANVIVASHRAARRRAPDRSHRGRIGDGDRRLGLHLPGFARLQANDGRGGVLAQLVWRAGKRREGAEMDGDDDRGTDHLERESGVARAHGVVPADR